MIVCFVDIVDHQFKLFINIKQYSTTHLVDGAVVVVIVWWLDLQLPMQSVSITTKVVS